MQIYGYLCSILYSNMTSVKVMLANVEQEKKKVLYLAVRPGWMGF